MPTKLDLANTARAEAMKTYHDAVMGVESNIHEIIQYFLPWSLEEAAGLWCAAFVYHCCQKAGYSFPIRPKECVSCNLAGCAAWEEWAKADNRIGWRARTCQPQPGDIVLFDKVFEGKMHDHTGIVLENRPETILTAEGNINGLSGILERPKDGHIRGYISLPDGFVY